ncbi:uncharacterized protein LOC131677058 [Topomyia yanbarensis]|uniref:uncharacterized protein LOC131677058 n=1 Tax=Topomyia yanbarensis TaxID=2498891 RepID=UPI00273B55CC|nr:uncharacterized protein LOC131677058 [Topomyia yanbarensis]
MYFSTQNVFLGFVSLALLQTMSCHTLPREKRQIMGPMEMGANDGERAAIPGLSEIQTAIQLAQFLISVGQQVVPVILENLTPPSTINRLNEVQLVEAVKRNVESLGAHRGS